LGTSRQKLLALDLIERPLTRSMRASKRNPFQIGHGPARLPSPDSSLKRTIGAIESVTATRCRRAP
jgi:hypothetical protein